MAGLPPKQQEAVLALLEHATVKSAAASCRVAERTLYRWMAEGPFKRAYREARRGSFGHSVSLPDAHGLVLWENPFLPSPALPGWPFDRVSKSGDRLVLQPGASPPAALLRAALPPHREGPPQTNDGTMR